MDSQSALPRLTRLLWENVARVDAGLEKDVPTNTASDGVLPPAGLD
jgi:hypothetical protein